MRSIFSEKTSACRIAYVSEECAADSEYSVTAGNAHFWWLRTPYSSYSYGVRFVSSDGDLSGNYAYRGDFGVRPLCNLKKIRHLKRLIFYFSTFFISNNSNFAFSFSSASSFAFSSFSLVVLSCGTSSTRISCSS